MAVLHRNGYVRGMNCYMTTVQAGGAVPKNLGGPGASASTILSCIDGGSPVTAGPSTRPQNSTLAGSLPTSRSTFNSSSSTILPLTTSTSTSAQVTLPSTSTQRITAPTRSILNTVSSPVQPLATSSPSQPTASPIQSQPVLSSTSTTSTALPSTQPPTTTISLQIVSSTSISSQRTSPAATQSSSTQPVPTTPFTSTTQPALSPSPAQSPTSNSTTTSPISSLFLNATLPASPTLPSAAPSIQTPDSSAEREFSGSGSALGPESQIGGITSKAGIILGIIIPVVLILAASLTIFCCQRNRRKQRRRQSLGYVPTTPKFQPFKRSEAKRQHSNFRNTIAYSEGLMDIGIGDRTSRKPMRDRSVQFPILEYLGKDSSSRPLPTMPGQAFAPLRVNRSSSIYSGSFYDSLTGANFPQQRSSTPLPQLFGTLLAEDNITNPFLTPAELERERKTRTMDPSAGANALLRPDVYTARPTSGFDLIEDDSKKRNASQQEVKDKDRDSAISDLSSTKLTKPLPLFSSLSRRPSTPDLTRPESLSALSSSSSASAITRLERDIISFRPPLDSNNYALNVGHQFGYSPSREFGMLGKGFDFEMKSARPKMQENGSISGSGSALKNEIVLVVGERDSRSSVGTLMEEWEMERKAMEADRVKRYRGMIKPGMGVHRDFGEWALGVQKRWTGRDY
ncbi:hypothetical protein VTL71DRAFT_1883 [Oculimacula yallundae]|uniref:Uncharacterized protein n=1 Tax=Oculimacula yallundae TaxID=86028 RepID=A0ABR4CBZ1_9HELO